MAPNDSTLPAPSSADGSSTTRALPAVRRELTGDDSGFSSKVGEFEAEDLNLAKSTPTAAGRRPAPSQAQPHQPRLVNVDTMTMKAVVPEQGSWHYERKKAIIAAHPEVLKLYGKNPWSCAVMLLAVAAQTLVAIAMRDAGWLTFLFVSYTVGTYLSWVCMVMGHEGAHGLVFHDRRLNKLHAIVAFLPQFIVPFGTFWSYEHMYHHQVVVDKMERYGPQRNPLLRKIVLSSTFIAVVTFLFFLTTVLVTLRMAVHFALHLAGRNSTRFPESYKLRPYNAFPQFANSGWFILNLLAIALYNGALFASFGPYPVLFNFLSNTFVNGLHPLGMRQVQEHYIQRRGQPTNSCYSSLGPVLFNIGYHNEHHDFPTIPWSRLPQVRKLAPEFYDHLFHYGSYTEVLLEFLTNEGIPFTSLLEDYDSVLGDAAQKLD